MSQRPNVLEFVERDTARDLVAELLLERSEDVVANFLAQKGQRGVRFHETGEREVVGCAGLERVALVPAECVGEAGVADAVGGEDGYAGISGEDVHVQCRQERAELCWGERGRDVVVAWDEDDGGCDA